jgi:hypothetical protein
MDFATTQLINKFDSYILNPILALIFAIGLLVFIYGIVEFLWGLSISGGENPKETGRKHMLWGIAGMFIMASALTIVNIIRNTAEGLLK